MFHRRWSHTDDRRAWLQPQNTRQWKGCRSLQTLSLGRDIPISIEMKVIFLWKKVSILAYLVCHSYRVEEPCVSQCTETESRKNEVRPRWIGKGPRQAMISTHTWTKRSDARCATQHIGLSLRKHVIVNHVSLAGGLHYSCNEERIWTSRDRTYWTMVIIFQYTLVANPTMMGPLKLQQDKPYLIECHQAEERRTSGLILLHLKHFVYEAGVTLTPLDVHRTPPVKLFCFPFRFPFFAQKMLVPCSREGSSRNPGLTVTA